MALHSTNDIENDKKLLGTSDSAQVIQRVNRILPSWVYTGGNGSYLDPEKFYIATSGDNYKLNTIQGIYQVYNQSTSKIVVSANAFDNSQTTLDLQPGEILQSLCTRSGDVYTYTKKVISFQSQNTPPSGNTNYTSPTSNNNLEAGSYYLSPRGAYFLEAPTTTDLPKEWYLYLSTGTEDATVQFQPGANTPIYFVKSGVWDLTTNETVIQVGSKEVVYIKLGNLSTAEQGALPSYGVTTTKTVAYTVDTIFQETAQTQVNQKTKHNLSALAAPTANNDSTEDYSIGSLWMYSGDLYVAVSVNGGSAVWRMISKPFGEIIPTVSVLPTDTEIQVVRLLGNSSLPDGLYTRDRNNQWLAS